MTNNKQQTEHRFCLTPELKCTMSYCDENGCMNRQRHLVGDPIEMTNNKQQTAVEWYIIQRDEIEMKIRLMLICANQYEQELIKADEQAKEMEIAGKEMSYADGYAEGYKRALEMLEWCIKHTIKGEAEE
jgi:hypothetical protein